jgi:hypothetical protein
MNYSKPLGMLAALVVFTSATFANAHSEKRCDFIPANTLRISEGLESTGGIDQAAFNRVIDKVSKVYAPVIKKKGGELIVKRLWSKSDVFKGQNGDYVNAFALQEGKSWYVAMFGGLARHTVTNEDGFTLVMCHEVGHHVGGFPKIDSYDDEDKWASNEGQADYFATMKCARQVWSADNNVAVVAKMTVPAIVKEKCSIQHKSSTEIALCERESMAGMNLGELLWSLSNGSKSRVNAGLAPTGLENIAGKSKPDFKTPNTTQVSRTNDAHPEAQCRLDTYFNGSICGVAASEDFGETSASVGACAEEKGDKLGFRSRCWFKPSVKF